MNVFIHEVTQNRTLKEKKAEIFKRQAKVIKFSSDGEKEDQFGFICNEDILEKFGTGIYFHRRDMDDPECDIGPDDVVLYDEILIEDTGPRAMGIRIRMKVLI